MTVPFYRLKGKVRFKNHDYSVLKVVLSPNTSMFSPVVVDEISLPSSESEGNMYLVNGSTHEVKSGIRKMERTVFDLADTLAGGEFIRWSTVHLWEDKYNHLTKSLAGSPDDVQLIEQCYQAFSNKDQYKIMISCLKDEKLFGQVVSVLQKAGIIKEDWKRVYYILHNKGGDYQAWNEFALHEKDVNELSLVYVFE